MKERIANRKRIFMWISEDLHRKAKAAAALEGRDLQDIVAECLIQRLNRMPNIWASNGSPDS